MSVKIVIADDQHLNRKASAYLLASRSDYQVVGQASNGKEALQAIKRNDPDILLLDLNMPIMDGFEVLETLQNEKSKVRTIVVSMNDQDKVISKCWDLGARGFLSTFNDSDQGETAIDSVMRTGYYFNARTNVSLLSDVKASKRSDFDQGVFTTQFDSEQIRVLKAFARQLTNAEIAEEIFASEAKVERIKASMVSKLQVRNFLSVFIYALQNGIIDVDSIPVHKRSDLN